MLWVDLQGQKSRQKSAQKKSIRWQPHVYEAFSDIGISNAIEVWKRLNPGEKMLMEDARKSVMEECFGAAYEGQYKIITRRKKYNVNSFLQLLK